VDDLQRLLEVMARLRDPESGCPWDREQTFQTIAPYTIEEAYEVADAIWRGDREGLREELGDLLFQVVFHARLAEEEGVFGFVDVVRAIVDKMVRRHPHVFGSERVDSAEAQGRAWEVHKAAERREKAAPGQAASHLDGVSLALPALVRAQKLQKRAARVGFDWPEVGGVLDKVAEEVEELRVAWAEKSPVRSEAELGDLLFSCVNLARHLGVDPETALRHANARFEARFRRMEARTAAVNRLLEEASLAELDAAWERAKAEERGLAPQPAPQEEAESAAGSGGGEESSKSSSSGSAGGLPS
jgi:MazG family protein